MPHKNRELAAAATTKTIKTDKTMESAKSSASGLVGESGYGQFGKKGLWYPCVVKRDNKDGTIKVKWDEDGKVTSRLPLEKFRPGALDDDEPVGHEVVVDLFGPQDNGDY